LVGCSVGTISVTRCQVFLDEIGHEL